jgi:hypothetical protein
MKYMLAWEFGKLLFYTLVAIQTQGTQRPLKLVSNRDNGKVTEEGLIHMMNFFPQIPVDIHNIIHPEHSIVAPSIKPQP